MAVTYASSPPSGAAVRAGLTSIFSGFRAALEEEMGGVRVGGRVGWVVEWWEGWR